MLPRLLLLLPTEKAPEKRLPVLGAPQLLQLQLEPLAVTSGNSPLPRLPLPPPPTLLWKELICGQTSFTRFQYRLFLGIWVARGRVGREGEGVWVGSKSLQADKHAS